MKQQCEPKIYTYQKNYDERGSFSTPFPVCTLSLLNVEELYFSVSQTLNAHTIRGMHFQESPNSEAKLLTVLHGAIFDILIDLRTLGTGSVKTHTYQLDAKTPQVLYIPRGFAHGYQTLSDDTDILYALDGKYEPLSASGFSPLSSEIQSLWPFEPSLIKQGDLQWPMLPE